MARERDVALICVYLFKLFLQFCHNKSKKHNVAFIPSQCKLRIYRDFLKHHINKAVLWVKSINVAVFLNKGTFLLQNR